MGAHVGLREGTPVGLRVVGAGVGVRDGLPVVGS